MHWIFFRSEGYPNRDRFDILAFQGAVKSLEANSDNSAVYIPNTLDPKIQPILQLPVRCSWISSIYKVSRRAQQERGNLNSNSRSIEQHTIASFITGCGFDLAGLYIHAASFIAVEALWPGNRLFLETKTLAFSIAHHHTQGNTLIPTHFRTDETAQHTEGLNMLAFLFSVLFGHSLHANATLKGVYKLQPSEKRGCGARTVEHIPVSV